MTSIPVPAPRSLHGPAAFRTAVVAVFAPLVLLVLLAPRGALAQDPFPAEPDLAVMLHYLVEDGATPGIVFGVLGPGGDTRVHAAGTTGVDGGEPGARTVFEIGSITKTFTAALLADMVARGEVGLEDPVGRYLPESVRPPSFGAREITLLDLATHRSGLPGLPDNHLPMDPADPYGHYTVDDLYAFLSSHELRREPGSEAEYSNLGYGLLGHVLARAAGAPYRELLRERVLEPLGMTDTGWATDGEAGVGIARGHRHGLVVRHWTVTEAFDGAGGLLSTAADLLRYLAANVGPPTTPLERAMREAHRPRAAFTGDTEIGLAWRVERRDDRTIVQHGGVSGGFSAMIGFDPDRGVGFVRLANTGRFPDNLGLHFLRTGPPPSVREVAVPADALARFAGTYELAPGTHFFIRLEEDGTLTAQGGLNTVRFRMYADSDTSFVVKRVPSRLAFRTDDAGAVTAMVLGQRTLPRVSDDTPPPGLPTVEIRDLALTAAELARYAGAYVLRTPGGPVEVEVAGAGDRLTARIRGGVATRLMAQGDHEFVMESDPDGRVVFVVDGDRATGIRVRIGDALLAGERRP